MICITGYGGIDEKPRVGYFGQFFRAHCRKNCALDRKMIDNFFNALYEQYHHAKFGDDRTTRAGSIGAKIWCLYVYLQDVAKWQTAGIKFTHRPKINISHAGTTLCTDSCEIWHDQGTHYVWPHVILRQSVHKGENAAPNIKNPRFEIHLAGANPISRSFTGFYTTSYPTLTLTTLDRET